MWNVDRLSTSDDYFVVTAVWTELPEEWQKKVFGIKWNPNILLDLAKDKLDKEPMSKKCWYVVSEIKKSTWEIIYLKPNWNK